MVRGQANFECATLGGAWEPVRPCTLGLFELVDLVGLDTRLSILEYLHRSLGEKYRPSPLLVRFVKEGRLGRKVGRGVYEYPS